MDERHGFGLLTETDLRSGTLYPLLLRLEKLGWLQSRWDEDDAPGPRRRLYRLTATGESAARKLLSKPEDQSSEVPRPLPASPQEVCS